MRRNGHIQDNFRQKGTQVAYPSRRGEPKERRLPWPFSIENSLQEAVETEMLIFFGFVCPIVVYLVLVSVVLGRLGGSVVERLPLVQVVIMGSWDRVPCRAPRREPASPFVCVSASLCVSHE